MLFSLHPNTPQCDVFRVLNEELLHFLRQSVNATVFSEALFSTYVIGQVIQRSECWVNVATREKFLALWEELPVGRANRQRLYDQINDAQIIQVYFDDAFSTPPSLTGDLFEVFKQLTTHLFTRTANLREIEQQSGTTVRTHYQRFRQVNANTQLCYLCATNLLSQDRVGLSENEQWRADYDHLLCKDKYPVYAVHPGNFMPTCHICNSKAKGSIDLLFQTNRRRRIALYPLPPVGESCSTLISLTVEPKQLAELIYNRWDRPLHDIELTFDTTNYTTGQKIDCWAATYQVPLRVKAHIGENFIERLVADLQPRDFEDFKNQLRRFSATEPVDMKRTEWRFWWFKLYQFLAQQQDGFLENIWSLIEWKLAQINEQELDEVYEN